MGAELPGAVLADMHPGADGPHGSQRARGQLGPERALGVLHGDTRTAMRPGWGRGVRAAPECGAAVGRAVLTRCVIISADPAKATAGHAETAALRGPQGSP